LKRRATSLKSSATILQACKTLRRRCEEVRLSFKTLPFKPEEVDMIFKNNQISMDTDAEHLAVSFLVRQSP